METVFKVGSCNKWTQFAGLLELTSLDHGDAVLFVSLMWKEGLCFWANSIQHFQNYIKFIEVRTEPDVIYEI